MLLAHLLRHVVRRGTLRVIDAGGALYVFAGDPGPCVTMRLHDKALGRQLFWNARLRLGEAYMDGRLTVEDADIYDLIAFFAENLNVAPRVLLTPVYEGLGRCYRTLQQFNPARRAQRNVAHH